MSQVDVVIPCYNYAHFLRTCVESVLSQTGVDTRVLIIDDASPDNTPEICRELAAQDSRVEFRRHSQNMGHIRTYNEGLLEWASADYSMLLSADDALVPGALARAVNIMDRHCEVGMTYGMALVVASDEFHTVAIEADPDEYRIISGDKFLLRCFAEGNAVQTPTVVVRTKLQQLLGGYRKDLPHSCDMEMWMRFASNAPVAVLRGVQAYYRWHNNNMSSRYYSQVLGDKREVIQACEEILTRWSSKFPASGSWRGLMLQRIGEETFWMASDAFDNGDMEEFQTILTFTEEVYPDIRFSKKWWRLQAKKCIGQALWKRILPTIKRLRGMDGSLPDSRVKVHTRKTYLSGWWPEAYEC